MRRLFLMLVLASTSVFADVGKVVKVLDGDTIKVVSVGVTMTVRLGGIDAPEVKQAYGAQARKVLSDMVLGRNVTVVGGKKDKYGRTISVVLLDGRNVSQEMVSRGAAWWYKQYAPRDKVLSSLQDQARKDKIGLWADASPVPPWVFRKKGRS